MTNGFYRDGRVMSSIGIRGLGVLLLAASLFAHGGFDHVRGTVVSVSAEEITVKTSTGNVTVKLDGKTQFLKNERKAAASDITPGARVIVEAPQDKTKAAQSVKVGEAAVPGKGKK